MKAQTNSAPPLSQSRQGDMACSLLYQVKHVQGVRTESEASRRGSEIHRVIAQYTDALQIEKVKTDYEKMAELVADASPEAREVLERFCESWFIDSEKIYDTELYIAADNEFKILAAHGKSERKDDEDKPGVGYEATIDLTVMESEVEATIYDWKSYYQIVDADTFQSKIYPLLLMLLNPKLQRVRFVLSFVRYGDAKRDVVWTREDVPKLKELARHERARQIDLHTKPASQLKPTPGRHCTWCPLLLTDCPMKKLNPYGSLELPERVALAVWMSAAKKENDRILKDWVMDHGPVIYKDANDAVYEASFKKSDQTIYPLWSSNNAIEIWIEAHEEDKELRSKLRISGLTSVVKVKKRAELAKNLNATSETKTLTKFVVGQPDDEDEE